MNSKNTDKLHLSMNCSCVSSFKTGASKPVRSHWLITNSNLNSFTKPQHTVLLSGPPKTQTLRLNRCLSMKIDEAGKVKMCALLTSSLPMSILFLCWLVNSFSSHLNSFLDFELCILVPKAKTGFNLHKGVQEVELRTLPYPEQLHWSRKPFRPLLPWTHRILVSLWRMYPNAMQFHVQFTCSVYILLILLHPVGAQAIRLGPPKLIFSPAVATWVCVVKE